MRECEVDANVDYGRISLEIDDDVFDKFRNLVRKRVKTCLAKFVREVFGDYILSGEKIDAVSLKKFDLETIRAIKSLENREEGPNNSAGDVFKRE